MVPKIIVPKIDWMIEWEGRWHNMWHDPHGNYCLILHDCPGMRPGFGWVGMRKSINVRPSWSRAIESLESQTFQTFGSLDFVWSLTSSPEINCSARKLIRTSNYEKRGLFFNEINFHFPVQKKKKNFIFIWTRWRDRVILLLLIQLKGTWQGPTGTWK